MRRLSWRYCLHVEMARFRVLAVLLVATVWAGAFASAEERGADGSPPPVAEPFTASVLATGLDFPWEMLWGPDNMLWVSERHGLRITRVDPATGAKKVAGEIPEAYPGPQHEGVLGMAFGPGFLEAGADSILYVYYTCKDKDSDKRWGRIAAYKYDKASEKIAFEALILDNLPAGDDHNGGRLRLGPDGKLYLTIGEQGHNQGANYCLPIEAQRLPSRRELANKNWDAYRGKSLRINLDGGIPEDNPEIAGVRSHVFTYGHRNPQGLAFVGTLLFSCEQGPSTDDEINLLEAGGNYGWPHIAGYRDDMAYVYANYSQAANCKDLKFDANVIPDGVPMYKETDWDHDDFKPPLKTLFTVRSGHNFTDPKCGAEHAYVCWPTVAPSCIVYYPADGAIPGWRNSLLVATLKSGALYRLPLSGDARQVQGDVDKLFRSRNRYRAIAFDPEGRNIYIACDNGGSARDDEGNPVASVRNPGAILVFTYNEMARK